ncbi:glycosyltransferase family 76 protein [Tilletiaria anomala UBC 951]|uniref:GPI mannosyltransferase 2 n=1 Tax=Tilletiaria anomala (strain ATCC 24038 / CBS 436.72 / UBC 951) TaxID=1037660 RepID=A0A066W6K0_TILAU|nr:glycosyltransferase family 76 protein [Tilletiaria anomala UBC 951]KDN49607.1 glycosyltransferase family 76 protein [Tilletiaria anomala UBC 951]
MAAKERLGRSILIFTLAHRLFAFVLLQLCGQLLPSFDASASILLLSVSPSLKPWLVPLVRWDTLHFLGVASPKALSRFGQALPGGYAYEHSLAFQPGLPVLMRQLGSSTHGTWSLQQSIVMSTLLAWVCSCLSPWLLFQLTARHFSSIYFAYLASLLSILSPSPASMIIPSPEVFFSCFAVVGLLLLAPPPPSGRGQQKPSFIKQCMGIIGGSFAFAICTAFRANGILLAGFLLWAGLWQPALQCQPTLERVVLGVAGIIGSIVAVAPFAAGQLWAYGRFCRYAEEPRPWCDGKLPLVYSFVQRDYWDVGLLRYWSLGQLPNFLLAAPVLLLIGWSHRYSRDCWRMSARSVLAPWAADAYAASAPSARCHSSPTSIRVFALDAITSPSALPHVIYLWANGVLLLFASHVQIALRFASPGGLPVLWWSAADIFLLEDTSPPTTASSPTSSPSSEASVSASPTSRQGDKGRLHAQLSRKGSWLMSYLVGWNIVSLILYAGFYPPA